MKSTSAALSVGLALVTGSATAEVVTHGISGTVTSASVSDPGGVVPGDISVIVPGAEITGSISYDTDQNPFSVGPDSAGYID